MSDKFCEHDYRGACLAEKFEGELSTHCGTGCTGYKIPEHEEDPECEPCDQYDEGKPCSYDPETGYCGSMPCMNDECNAVSKDRTSCAQEPPQKAEESASTTRNTGSPKLLDELEGLLRDVTFSKIQKAWRAADIIKQLRAGA